MSHRFHPDPSDPYNDPPDAIYYDDCEDCKHHAERTPYYADQNTFQKLWTRMMRVELSDDDSYRSENERKACQILWTTFIILERFTSIDPRKLFPIQDA